MIRSFATHVLALAAGIAIAVVCASLTTGLKSELLSTSRPAPVNEFDGALRAVRVQMDAGMCITPSGSADRDFARAMIPHHQGAIEMARLELLHGQVDIRRWSQPMKGKGCHHDYNSSCMRDSAVRCLRRIGVGRSGASSGFRARRARKLARPRLPW